MKKAPTLAYTVSLEFWWMGRESHRFVSRHRNYRVTRDRDWLGNGPGSPLQAMLDAFDWISIQRRRTIREEDGKKVPHWGLLPAGGIDDWIAGNVVGNDAACILG